MRLSSLRRTAAVAVSGLLLLAAAACGANDEPAGTSGSQAASAAFPVSIEHKHGTTSIPAEPRRIVAVGLVEQDALLALGVVPVATTEWFGGHPGAIWPWAKDKLGGGTVPEVLTNTDGIQFEKVAAQRPDLILGIYSGMTAEDYATLSKIAPTIGQPKGAVDYGASWQDVTTTVGTAIGKKAEADKMVADQEAAFEKIRADNPKFAGATGLMVTNYEGYYVYGPQDMRGHLLEDLGFKLPDGLAEVTGKEFGANLSKERTDLLDTDVLIWLINEYDKDKATVQADPLYAKLKVKTEGRDIYLENEELVGSATSFISILSLPYLLERLVPQLNEAVDGDPATAVKRPVN